MMGSVQGGSMLVHVETNNVEREGATAIVKKYRQSELFTRHGLSR